MSSSIYTRAERIIKATVQRLTQNSPFDMEEVDIDVNGCLVVEKEEPRRYKFTIALFNGSNKELSDLRLVGPPGHVAVLYSPDLGQRIFRKSIPLRRDEDRIATVFFEDKFDDIIWNDVLEISILFYKGTIHFESVTGVQTNAANEWTLKIKNKPGDVFGMTYELLPS